MDERIFFKVRINIPDLDKHDPDAQKSTPEHEAELVFETNDDYYIKIFFDPKESLDRKVMNCEPSYSYTLRSNFIVTDVVAPNRLKHIDFCHYEHKGMASEKVDGFGRLHFGYFAVRGHGISHSVISKSYLGTVC